MFRSIAAGEGRPPRWARAARPVDLIRAAGLLVVVVTVCLAQPGPAAPGGRGTAIAAALAASAATWIAWMAAERRPRLQAAATIAMALAGGTLAGLSPASPAVAVGCMVCFSAAASLPVDRSLGIAAATVAAFLVAAVATGAPALYLAGYPFAYAGLWTTGLTRRSHALRADQAEHLLEQARRARAAETAAAALAERARIAREIHDVLADSLAAVSVNLQAAEGLLAALPPGSAEAARLAECVGRAATFTRQGMADARRAILALREDAAPLADQLSALAGQHRADGDAAVEFAVTGEPRLLGAEASLAAYRTAQEALTNARKHAPGQPVTLRLGFHAGHVTVTVRNPLPGAGAPGQLAGAGAGYGLAGLRERAALTGGLLEAGPAREAWQVSLTIPA